MLFVFVCFLQPGLGLPPLPPGALGGALEQIKAAGSAPHLNPAFLQEMAAQSAQGNMQKMVYKYPTHQMERVLYLISIPSRLSCLTGFGSRLVPPLRWDMEATEGSNRLKRRQQMLTKETEPSPAVPLTELWLMPMQVCTDTFFSVPE